jgi:hypothetical protein
MLLWLGSASRHLPSRGGPVAASIVASERALATGREVRHQAVIAVRPSPTS